MSRMILCDSVAPQRTVSQSVMEQSAADASAVHCCTVLVFSTIGHNVR